MQEKSDHPELMNTVMEIKGAEEHYSKILAKAQEDADMIMRKAKEEALEARRRNEEEMVATRNAMLQQGAQDIEAETNELLKKAKSEAAKTTKKGIEGKDAQTLAKQFLSSL